jgi:hypothetical protein
MGILFWVYWFQYTNFRYVHFYSYKNRDIGLDISLWLYLMTSRGTVLVLVLCYVRSDMSILRFPPFLPDPVKTVVLHEWLNYGSVHCFSSQRWTSKFQVNYFVIHQIWSNIKRVIINSFVHSLCVLIYKVEYQNNYFRKFIINLLPLVNLQ